MFHDANMKSFRSQRVYEEDFPSKSVPVHYEQIDLAKFNAKRYLEKTDVATRGTAWRYVMTVSLGFGGNLLGCHKAAATFPHSSRRG